MQDAPGLAPASWSAAALRRFLTALRCFGARILGRRPPEKSARGLAHSRTLSRLRIYSSTNPYCTSFVGRYVAVFALLLAVSPIAHSAVPPVDRLLPDDTLFMVTTPDFTKLLDLAKKMPEFQLWNDPAMRPFREHFMSKFRSELLDPLQRELGVDAASFADLPRGQVTFAVTQNGWHGGAGQEPGAILLVDTRDMSGQLRTNLAALRRKWNQDRKPVRTEMIRGQEFLIVPLTTNEIPKAIRSFLPADGQSDDSANDVDSDTGHPRPKAEMVIGQVDSLLIVANGIKPAQKVMEQLSGGTAPTLAELRAYQADQMTFFRDACVYSWINTKAMFDIAEAKPALPPIQPAEDSGDAPSGMVISPPRVGLLSASGVKAIRTIAFSVNQSAAGSLMQFFVRVPESQRTGIFKMLAIEPKDASPPPFVPANVAKYQRWRIDGQKAWATIERELRDAAPGALNQINYMIDLADQRSRRMDPDFDLRKNLIGNLGDDLIIYELPPAGTAEEDYYQAPSMVLIGSPDAQRFGVAIKGILAIASTEGELPPEREFLGRKIQAATIPSNPTGGPPAPGQMLTRTVYVSASGGYLAIATDQALLEQYLRSSDSRPKALRDTPGLADAAQRVTTPDTGLFGFDSDLANARYRFESSRSDTNAIRGYTYVPLPGVPDMPDTQKSYRQWMDYRLLPEFSRIAKYFNFSVYGGAATTDGFSVKLFTPTPPGLRQ